MIDENLFKVAAPDVSTSGKIVSLVSHELDGAILRRVQTPDLSEIYFEVTMYPGSMKLENLIESQIHFLNQNSSDGTLSDVEKVILLQYEALSFAFQGTIQNHRKNRKFVYFNAAEHVFRIVYDPTSESNIDLLSSFRIRTD